MRYQHERFPFLVHGPLIAIFTFSAISYSRICRNEIGFIPWTDFLIGVFATVTLFFLVRVFDEFKDQEEDALYRSYLPVPRGLISLQELKIIGAGVGLLQIALILFFQLEMIYLYGIVLAYLVLMGVEFFVPDWLKKRQLLYITSHMVIIPLIDIYASGLDWLLAGAEAHSGLLWFFAVSYLNGLALEFGRKIRSPQNEEEGVLSYTKMYGTKKGAMLWILLVFSTMLLAMGAANYAGYGSIAFLLFGICFLICIIPAVLFLKKPTSKSAQYIEYASVLWTALMYLSLGGIPMFKNLLSL